MIRTARPMRALVGMWYSPATETWVRWREESGPFSAGDAMLRAANFAEWMPGGRRYVDQWVKLAGKWIHETRYRFGTESGT
jgi:hypothetical protein